MWPDQSVLADITRALANFLARELPRLHSADWWKTCVLSVLTLQQCEQVERRRVTSLTGLDLAALLRVLDQNWSDISTSLKWPREIRNFVKEAQSIRNRWAHAGSHPPTKDDMYRDLDTLERLVKAIGDTELAASLGRAKREALRETTPLQQPATSVPTQVPDPEIPPADIDRRSPPPTKDEQGSSQRVIPSVHELPAPDLVLIGCVKTKIPGRHKAKDLFTSPLFHGRRQRAEAQGVSWFILSAKYGLLSPETDVDYYDVSLKAAGTGERRSWSKRVLEQLRNAVGSVSGKVVEVHAGAAYFKYGLADGLKAQGATVVVPLEHATQGEQLAWYASIAAAAAHIPTDTRPRQLPAGEAPQPRLPDPAAELEVTIINATPIKPFTFRWPVNTEEFTSGWEFLIHLNGESYRVRHGIGCRHCFGRMRTHSVTWLDGHPMVEGAEAEDFAQTRDLVSVLKAGGGNRDARSLDEVDAAYAALRVVRHCDAIVGANARGGLAVRIRDDDLESWARHTLLRARAKGARPVGAAVAPRREPDSPAAGTVPAAPTDVVNGLLAFGRSLTTSGGSFTPNPKADAFVRRDAFAFLVAVICDEQVRFERAWEAPLLLRERLGHWDIQRMASEPGAVRAAFAVPPALHRWVKISPDRVVAAATRVMNDYKGDAGSIWRGQPSAWELRERFERFDGIGQKKSAMAVELLERELHVPLRQLTGSDVAVDVHVRRVFLRAGLAEHDGVEHIVAAARAAHPERPGELDHPAWEIGRTWCRPSRPDCEGCPIGTACPRLIDRAAGVRGA